MELPTSFRKCLFTLQMGGEAVLAQETQRPTMLCPLSLEALPAKHNHWAGNEAFLSLSTKQRPKASYLVRKLSKCCVKSIVQKYRVQKPQSRVKLSNSYIFLWINWLTLVGYFLIYWTCFHRFLLSSNVRIPIAGCTNNCLYNYFLVELCFLIKDGLNFLT